MWAQEKQQLDQGVEIENCQVCWKDEAAGRVSYRQQNATSTVNFIELYLNNVCNHMCSYCSPKFSSTWEESIKTQGHFNNISNSARRNLEINNLTVDNTYWTDQIEDYIGSQPDNSITLKLLGGEPLMQQRNLERLLSLNNNKIKTLCVHTNLNPPSNKFLIWLLETFPKEKLQIEISIDASPDYNHVVRGGFDKDRFLENLSLLKKYKITYKLTPVISVLSIFDTVNFVKWNAKEGHPVKYHRVSNPECLQPTLIPLEFRQEILKYLVTPGPLFQDILTDTTQPNPARLLEQYNYLTEYFKRVNIDTCTIDNSLFQTWWTWLEKTVNK
jgi:organic radical activating enzyme